tara:strand:+ start:273 stop:431 length:159 start_codon:yes stop_codon:yes gene_type:complete
VVFSELYVSPYRHVVMHVIGDQIYPFTEPAFIQKFSLIVKKLLDLPLQKQAF